MKHCVLFIIILLRQSSLICAATDEEGRDLGQWYLQGNEFRFLTDMPKIVEGMYMQRTTGAPITCSAEFSTTNTTLDAGKQFTSEEVQAACGKGHCIVPATTTVRVTSSMELGTLLVRGTLLWDSTTMTSNFAYLCATMIIVADGGRFVLNLSNPDLRATIHILAPPFNLLEWGHEKIGWRALAATGAGTTMEISGSHRVRTWSLLTADALHGADHITLAHDAAAMGWRVGDRIGIAPTTARAVDPGVAFFIKSIDGYKVYLGDAVGNSATIPPALGPDDFNGGVNRVVYGGDLVHLQQAEVVLLSHNVLITGDPFVNVPAGELACVSADYPRTQCTYGLHTVYLNDASGSMKYTRLEGCGQRGVLAKYCAHFHVLRKCKTCVFEGLAIDSSMQRGIVVHGTSFATVTKSVLWNVRGASIYLEDGDEFANDITFNVAICPNVFRQQAAYPEQSALGGCSVPGTDNADADTASDVSAIWGASHRNNFIGNRAANNFNGFFLDTQVGATGRGQAHGEVCPTFTRLGRVIGNTFHSNGRFGTYFVADSWPRQITLDTNGRPLPNIADGCAAWESGLPSDTLVNPDRSFATAIIGNYDYGNDFVGLYQGGNIAFRDHVCRGNNNNFYHKQTKDFPDGCSGIWIQMSFQGFQVQAPPANRQQVLNNIGLAGGEGAQIFDSCSFSGSLQIEANHHCLLGKSGGLCNALYIFWKANWEVTDVLWWWYQNHPPAGVPLVNAVGIPGGVFTLSPADAYPRTSDYTMANLLRSVVNPGGHIFPIGFQALIHDSFTWMLDIMIPAPPTVQGSEPGSSVPACAQNLNLSNGNPFNALNNGRGILCRPRIRTITIYTRGLQALGRGQIRYLVLLVENVLTGTVVRGELPWRQTPEAHIKQGFTGPIIVDNLFKYTLQQMNGTEIPSDWIVVFSDPVIGNHWAPEFINLNIKGWSSCPTQTSSQHDRRYIWAGFDEDSLTSLANGRGACQGKPDMPSVNCSAIPKLGPGDCPAALCGGDCPTNSYCDCSTAKCECDVGFSRKEPNLACEVDVCAGVNCNGHGVCSLRYLGGTLPSSHPCQCTGNWRGKNCEHNPCANVTCSGHGFCEVTGEKSYKCNCIAGWTDGGDCSRSADFCLDICGSTECPRNPGQAAYCQFTNPLLNPRPIAPCAPEPLPWMKFDSAFCCQWACPAPPPRCHLPCHNGGRCVNPSGSDMFCSCIPPWSGAHCNETCDGFCGSTSLWPYGCGITDPSFHELSVNCISGNTLQCSVPGQRSENSCCFKNCRAPISTSSPDTPRIGCSSCNDPDCSCASALNAIEAAGENRSLYQCKVSCTQTTALRNSGRQSIISSGGLFFSYDSSATSLPCSAVVSSALLPFITCVNAAGLTVQRSGAEAACATVCPSTFPSVSGVTYACENDYNTTSCTGIATAVVSVTGCGTSETCCNTAFGALDCQNPSLTRNCWCAGKVVTCQSCPDNGSGSKKGLLGLLGLLGLIPLMLVIAAVAFFMWKRRSAASAAAKPTFDEDEGEEVEESEEEVVVADIGYYSPSHEPSRVKHFYDPGVMSPPPPPPMSVQPHNYYVGSPTPYL